MEEVPLIKALHAKYSNDAAIVGVSVDINVSRVDQTVKEKQMTWSILADGKGFDGPIATAYHVQGTPELFVLDRAGNIFARPESAKQIEASLNEALAQRR
jgi:hypothetical protein